MRIIAGKYKGRNIVSPHGKTRPTTDMVREALFSMLCSRDMLCGDFLDLFCGSGAVGIEALSRGAKSCCFVDVDTSDVNKNLTLIGIDARIIKADFRRAIRLLKNQKFDVIFADPPYSINFYDDIIENIFRYDVLKPSGLIIIEHACQNNLINPPKNCIIESREMGAAALEIIQRGKDESNFGGDV